MILFLYFSPPAIHGGGLAVRSGRKRALIEIDF